MDTAIRRLRSAAQQLAHGKAPRAVRYMTPGVITNRAQEGKNGTSSDTDRRMSGLSTGAFRNERMGNCRAHNHLPAERQPNSVIDAQRGRRGGERLPQHNVRLENPGNGARNDY